VKQNWKGLGTYGTVGLEFAISVLFGLFVGQWLDKKVGSSGWITLIGFGLGLAAGVRSLIRAAKQAKEDAERIDREEREARKKYDEDGDHEH
jgi:ATP synthase protein I